MRPLRLFLEILLLATSLGAAAPSVGAHEEFFIVSSLDAHGRIVLKRPTEVTLLMRVTGETAYRDERGRLLTFKDLKTGDTGYITFRQDPGGEPTALLVRLGPMTVEELHRRYLPKTPG